jgi:hypothetical protein
MVKDILEDTLKKKTEEGGTRWSRTSLTMFSSWIISITMATADFIKNGFDFKVFLVFVGAAISTKLADSIGISIVNLTSK